MKKFNNIIEKDASDFIDECYASQKKFIESFSANIKDIFIHLENAGKIKTNNNMKVIMPEDVFDELKLESENK